MTIRVELADDQPLVRAGLRVLIADTPDIEVTAEAANGTDAVRLARESRPDVVLMDIRMPGMDGIEATQLITAGDCPARVIILTTFDDDDNVYRALQAGASGFLVKDMPLEDILAAIRVVAAGDALIAPSVTRRLIRRLRRPPAESTETRGYRRHHGARTRSADPRRAGHVQQRDRRKARHQQRHRQSARRPAARQAPCPRPGATRHHRLPRRSGSATRRPQIAAQIRYGRQETIQLHVITSRGIGAPSSKLEYPGLPVTNGAGPRSCPTRPTPRSPPPHRCDRTGDVDQHPQAPDDPHVQPHMNEAPPPEPRKRPVMRLDGHGRCGAAGLPWPAPGPGPGLGGYDRDHAAARGALRAR